MKLSFEFFLISNFFIKLDFMLRFYSKIILIFIWFLNGLNLYSEEVVVELKNGASVSGDV